MNTHSNDKSLFLKSYKRHVIDVSFKKTICIILFSFFWVFVMCKARRWSNEAAIKTGARRRSESCFVKPNTKADQINPSFHQVTTII